MYGYKRKTITFNKDVTNYPNIARASIVLPVQIDFNKEAKCNLANYRNCDYTELEENEFCIAPGQNENEVIIYLNTQLQTWNLYEYYFLFSMIPEIYPLNITSISYNYNSGDYTLSDFLTLNGENNSYSYTGGFVSMVGTQMIISYESTTTPSKIDGKSYVDNQVSNLQTELLEKANSADLATVATSGSYTDLSNKPTIPTAVSDLTNDAGYITQHQDISGKANVSDLAVVATSGSYNDLNNKPTIPTAVSELTNDSNFTTKTYVDNLEKERLASLDFTEDDTPYLFRKSGGNVNEEPVIVGGTVKYNQLVYDGNFSETPTSWKAQNTNASISIENGVATVTLNSGSANAYTPAINVYSKIPNKTNVLGHKILEMFDIKPPHDGTCYASAAAIGTFGRSCVGNSWNHIELIRPIINDTENEKVLSYIGMNGSDIQIGESISYRNISCYDLTDMFGSTIADHVYSLEQSTAGSGFAWLRKYGYFTKDYYPYSEPTFKHVEGLVEHKMVGFNQWDEEWELGIYDLPTGAKINNSNNIRNKNLVPVLPNTTYCWNNSESNVIRWVYFNANKERIGSWGSTQTSPITFTTSADTHYMAFYFSGTTYKGNLCISISDPTKNGTYAHYKEYTYPLDSNVVLRGFPKLDSNNNLYFDGDVYKPDGTVRRWYDIITFDGTQTVENSSFSGTINNAIVRYVLPKVSTSGESGAFGDAISDSGLQLVNRYAAGSFSTFGTSEVQKNGFGISSDGKKIVFGFSNPNLTSVADVNAYLAQHPITVVYEVATPTEETAAPFQSPQVVDGFGTEEWVFDDNAFPVPVGHETTYRNIVTMQDVKNIQSDIDDIQFDLNNKQDILTFDSTPTANSTNPVTSGGIKTALDNKETAINNVEVSGISPVIVADSNTIYNCGEVTSLSFTPCASGICDVRFTSGSTVTVLTIPNTVKFPNSFDPTNLETNKIYEINILDGIYGVVTSWAI